MAVSYCARAVLTFPDSLVRSPVLARLIREFDVTPNIRRAEVSEINGRVVCEIEGAQTDVDAAFAWLRDQGIHVDVLEA